MKLDKEVLIKQRFWVLLGLVVPLVLIAIMVLIFGVRAAIAKLQAEVDKQIAAPTKITDTRNQAWVDKLKEDEKAWDKIMQQVWKEAWNGQVQLVTWPKDVQARFNAGLFATKVKVTRGGKGAGAGKGTGGPKTEIRTSNAEKSYLIRGTITAVEARHFNVRARVEKDLPAGASLTKTTDKDRWEEREFKFLLTPNMLLSVGTEKDALAESFNKLQVNDQVDVTYYQGKYFGDDFILQEKTSYTNAYDEQFPPLRSFLTNAAGEVIVQLKDGWKDRTRIPKMIRHVRVWPKDPPPSSEEIWNAQEDLWIQRELLRVIQTANNYVARFQSAGSNGGTFVFTNPYWKFELKQVADPKDGLLLVGTLTNISRQLQNLNLTFRIQTVPPRKDGKVVIEAMKVFGPPVKPHASVPIRHVITTENPEALLAVEQVLTPSTAPIKRLDDIQLSNHSHRTFPKGVVPRHGIAVPKAAPAKNQGNAMGNIGGNVPLGVGGGKDKDKAAAKGPVGRYSDATEQFRKMPVVMVLLVDQDSAHYVLTAFEESKLRFQITQVLMTRASSLKDLQKKGDRGGERRAEARAMPPMGERGGAMPGMGRFGAFGPPMGGILNPRHNPDSGSITSTTDQQPLMELVVYGYATLYERYPARNPNVMPKAAPKQGAR